MTDPDVAFDTDYLRLAYALNDVYDKDQVILELEQRVEELDYELEMHECYEEHDDCVYQEDYDDLHAEKERVEVVVRRLKETREAIWWERSRVPAHKQFVINDFTDQLRILDGILEGHR